METGSISEEEFLTSARTFFALSTGNVDIWELKKAPNKGNSCYLQKKTCQRVRIHREENSQELPHSKEVQEDSDTCSTSTRMDEEEDLTFEYHVVYSPSYGVPVLYFNIYRQDGSLLSLSEVWSLVPEHYKDRLRNERWSFITQQEHPIVGRPYFYLHPCHTANLMKQVGLSEANKPNYILSWLSAVGPVVLLEIPLVYGKNMC